VQGNVVISKEAFFALESLDVRFIIRNRDRVDAGGA
jgi:hypothetical protein